MTSEQTDDVSEAEHHEEVRANGDRVIVVNSQPPSGDAEVPRRKLRSLGAVSAHATDPITGDSRPRRGSTRRGSPLVALLVTAVPFAAVALGISYLDGRVAILASTAVLALVWLLGIAAAWRGLGPGRRDSSGVWLGRAVGLVLGALVAVYLLLDTVTPLL